DGIRVFHVTGVQTCALPISPRRPDARTLIDTVLDPGSFVSWDEPPHDPAPPGSAYARELAEARARTGYDEAVVTGEGRIDGRRENGRASCRERVTVAAGPRS